MLEGSLRQLIGLTILAKLLVGVMLVLLLDDTAWVIHLVDDVMDWGPFYEQVRYGAIPYVDFSREYPVGAGIIYWLIAWLPNRLSYDGMLATHMAVISIIDVTNVALLFTILTRMGYRQPYRLALLFAVLPTNLLLSPVRFEAVTTTLVLLGYLAYLRRRTLVMHLLFALGCTVKWYPALFSAAHLVTQVSQGGKRRDALRYATTIALVIAAINLPFMLGDYIKSGGIDNWLSTYTFHADRGTSWDTPIGVLNLWSGLPDPGSWPVYWSALLICLVLAVRRSIPLAHKGVLVCIAALLVNKVYSAQFSLWFYPFLIIAFASEEERPMPWLLIWLVVVDLVNIVVYPFSFAYAFRELGGFAPSLAAERGGVVTLLFSTAVIARALVLIVIGRMLWRTELQESGTGDSVTRSR